MIISVSVVLLLGIAVFALCRRGGLKTWHAVICTLFGLYLAATPVAAPVHELTAELAQLVSGH